MKYTSGFVYVIRGAKRHKIGRSHYDPALRLTALQCGSPVRLKLICVINADNCVELETNLHSKFKDSRDKAAGREWFNLSSADLEYLAKLAAGAKYIPTPRSVAPAVYPNYPITVTPQLEVITMGFGGHVQLVC